MGINPLAYRFKQVRRRLAKFANKQNKTQNLEYQLGGIGATGSISQPYITALQVLDGVNTAGFYFEFIEQAGTSLYATLSQKVTSAEVLKITLSIGGSEIMHFQVWHDKAGNATPLSDNGITFVDLTKNQPETLQANLIMPEPCDFISTNLPQCAIIRPTSPGQLDATGAIKGFIADGLFIGQQRSQEFQDLILDMAAEADAARRELDE